MVLSASLIVVTLLQFVVFAESCAPYFNTEGWRSKAESFTVAKATQACKDAYNLIAANAIIVGDRYCTKQELFIGRWYCVKQCDVCGSKKSNVSLESVHCAAMRVGSGSNGKDPDQLFIKCDCDYKGIASCSTREEKWSTVEKLYSAACILPFQMPVCTQGGSCATNESCGRNGVCRSDKRSCCPVALTNGECDPPFTAVDCPADQPDPAECTAVHSACMGECDCLSSNGTLTL